MTKRRTADNGLDGPCRLIDWSTDRLIVPCVQEEANLDRHDDQDRPGARLQPEQQALQRGGLLHLRVSKHGKGITNSFKGTAGRDGGMDGEVRFWAFILFIYVTHKKIMLTFRVLYSPSIHVLLLYTVQYKLSVYPQSRRILRSWYDYFIQSTPPPKPVPSFLPEDFFYKSMRRACGGKKRVFLSERLRDFCCYFPGKYFC